MACVAVPSLMRTIELEFLCTQPRPIVKGKELISCNEELIQSLHKKLGSLIELFDENRMDSVKAIKDLETKLRDVAFRVEDEIELEITDLYVERSQGDIDEEIIQHCQRLRQIFRPAIEKSHPCLRLRHIIRRAKEDIDAIKEELVKVRTEYKHVITSQGRKTTADAFPKTDEIVMMGDSSQLASNSKDIMVGKNNEFQTIKEMLIQHPSKKREVVSIKGMGGIGKTTLARLVYEDPSIASHFDKRAWVVASQHHHERQMLAGLLKSLGKEDTGTDEDLKFRLYQELKGRRYLVVMDDVWSREARDALNTCFPDDNNCSRVLLTTRLEEVADCTPDNHLSHQMHLLDQSESWNLFREKACKFCGDEFEAIGKPIVEKCKGLPLAIVVVAGLFSKLNTLDEWKNISEALNSSATTTIDEECSRILSLSYNHLPHNLKACFLYLGVFPEDEEIFVGDLGKLWSAEGLAKASKKESYGAVARRYIQELIDRNLIMLSHRSSCGTKVKSFKMHDLLHAFCASKAQKENLLHVVRGSDFPQKGFRWLSIQSLVKFDVPTLHNISKSCRSIFHFTAQMHLDNLKGFKILRVICNPHLHNSNGIADSVHLRYVSEVDIREKTSKLLRAWNLQSLGILGDDARECLELPQLQDLRSSFVTGVHPPKFVHQNLRSISCLAPDDCTKEFFANIPYLNKVRIRGGARDCNDCIENLADLQQLEKLYIVAEWDFGIQINKHIVSLENLKKLEFYSTRFEGKEINVLSKLPRLKVLRLMDACVGKEWELQEEEEFCQLTFLEIAFTDLKHWKASAKNFPKLERLLLYRCYKLKEIPIEFADIPALKSIELDKCLLSTVISAKQIKEEQCEYGNDNMVVIEKYTLQLNDSDECESDEEEYDELEEDSKVAN